MKKIYTLVAVATFCLSMFAGNILKAQNVSIPDANFKAALVGNSAINTNGDAEIQGTEAQAYTGFMDLAGKGIGDLTGIEAFTSITQIDCSANHLTGLNVSNNTALTYLFLESNQLTSLDVSALTGLTNLAVNENELTSLDVSHNPMLNFLICSLNQLTSLNLRNQGNNLYMNCAANPSLFCIQVDDVSSANAYMNWYKDAGATYNTNCVSCTPTASTFTTTACGSYTWAAKGNKIYTSSNTTDTVQLVNAAGCDSIITLNLTIKNSTTSDTTATACNRYTWHGTTYNASGNYTFTTTNAAGCDSVITLYLTLTSLTTSSTKTDAGCFGSATGSLEVTPTSGVNPYTYRIGTSAPYISSGSFSNLKAGNYRVSVIDREGCSGTTSPITIGQSSPISATATPTAAVCNNTYTGAITINPSIPASYTYSIGTTGVYQSSNTFNSLRAGTYRVTIQDTGGCKTTLSNIVVNQPSAVAIVVNSVNNPNNAAQNNGSIAVSGTGGAVGGYLFKFGTGGTYQSSGRFINLKAGTYRIFIKDANDCAGASYAVTLTYNPARSTGIVKQRQVSSDIGNAENISISPNPTTSAFKVSVNGTQNETVHLRVMDVNGKVVYTTQGRSNQSFTFGEAFMVGMYMVEVRQGNEVKILKAIKMK